MSWAGIICSAVFLVVFGLIATERVDRTKAALAGGAFVLLTRLVDQRFAFHGGPDGAGGVDWNTVLLLVGAMVIINISRRTGMFEWLAIRVAKLAGGHPVGVLLLLSALTAVLSALLDNVTTVVTIVPVAILICEALAVDVVPYLVIIVIASNIGGASTLVGHPPNIMIGSATGYSFMDFLRVDGPIAGLVLILFLATAGFTMRRRLRATPEARARIMEFEEGREITDRPLLWRCLVVIALVLIGFLIHGRLGLEPATIALGGAALLLLLDRESAHEALAQVEWGTIFFFIGLFIVVSGLVETGVLSLLGKGILQASGGSVPRLTFGLVWVSGVTCGMIDHIPYTAAMIPIVRDMVAGLPPGRGEVLWWALSLGANLGANLTLIAAASNIVVAGLGERAGYRITFRRFLKYGAPVTVANLVLASLYLWLLFLR